MTKSLTLNKLRRTKFSDLYKKIALEDNINQIEMKKLLAIAVIFLNETDINIKKLGYRIIVFYSNQTNDYKPLYDVALNKGLYPVVKSIESKIQYSQQVEQSFFKLFQSSFGENYYSKGIYLSEEQKELKEFFDDNNEETVSIIAPTSYGKSDLIISTVKNNDLKNICIIVPTKALIAQTKKRLMIADLQFNKKIITHPEMYLQSDKNILSVLTQERLLRLLRKNSELKFDITIIDEAHNLLENNERSILLATAISILVKRNSSINIKFLTPFLLNTDNLSVRYTKYEISSYKITEYIKTERLYIYEERNSLNQLKLYDQFLNEFFLCEEEFKNHIDLIIKKSSEKNIIYFNKPSDIENFTRTFSEKFPDILTEKINEAIEHIGELIDPNYLLVECLRKGIVYHHGSVPENVKIYIEHLFSELNELNFVLTTSTLLEGVNIPAATLFLLDNKKGRGNLNQAQFRNLIGRICRFSELFSNASNLNQLEPRIYLIGSEYVSSNANLEKFIREAMRIDKKESEEPKNVLLENVQVNKDNKVEKEKADEFLENFEPGIIDNYKNEYAKSEIGKLCFENNITEIDILTNELEMQKIVDNINEQNINSSEKIFELFNKIFLPFIIENDKNRNLNRLKNDEAQKFYKMFFDWRIKGATYNEMISSFIRHWKKLIDKSKKYEEVDVFVGKWGDKAIDGFNPLWTDIKKKNYKEKVNIAIVRIKEEQDFLDNTLIKYVEVINDLGLINSIFYKIIKYGTADDDKILLIKNGLSNMLTNLIIKKYSSHLEIESSENKLLISSRIVQEMKKNNENEILIHEVKYNTKVFSK